MRVVQRGKHTGIVNAAVARYGEAAFQHSLTELESLSIGLFHFLRADVLEMYVSNARAEFLRRLDSILSGKSKVAGIKAKPNIARIGVIHQTLGFCKCLYNRCHMVVVAQFKPAVSSNLPQLVQSVRETLPLFV